MVEKVVVSVTFDGSQYVGRAVELSESLTALSLSVLRKKAEEMMRPDKAEVVLSLDKAARRERDQRRRGGHQAGAWPR